MQNAFPIWHFARNCAAPGPGTCFGWTLSVRDLSVGDHQGKTGFPRRPSPWATRIFEFPEDGQDLPGRSWARTRNLRHEVCENFPGFGKRIRRSLGKLRRFRSFLEPLNYFNPDKGPSTTDYTLNPKPKP